MHFKRPEKHDIGLDMTPIIDTVFNLLIFFALSFNFGITPGIQVKLPSAKADVLKHEKKEVIVVVTKDGSIFLEQKRIDLDEILKEFKIIFRSNPDIALIIQGDEESLYGKVVRIMDFAKRAGITKIAVATRPEEKVE
ncbi:MAG: biopolymer transporter ExbD [Deltaproteobacteria bacterium]|nr:biopolymer transporter ExbD [Deltaproteobacteria bacterium]